MRKFIAALAAVVGVLAFSAGIAHATGPPSFSSDSDCQGGHITVTNKAVHQTLNVSANGETRALGAGGSTTFDVAHGTYVVTWAYPAKPDHHGLKTFHLLPPGDCVDTTVPTTLPPTTTPGVATVPPPPSVDATTTVPGPAPHLPDTGGVARALALGGLIAFVAGVLCLTARRHA